LQSLLNVAQAKDAEQPPADSSHVDWKKMPTQSDGLNIIHGSSAVLLRCQIGRSDDLLKKDAILNAEAVLQDFPQVNTIHVLFGSTRWQHSYKRIDLYAKNITKISVAPDSLEILPWQAIKDEQLPGYTEQPKSDFVFSDDPEHCRHGNVLVVGSYTNANGGSLILARNEVEVMKHRLGKSPSDDIAIENAKPYEVLRAKFEGRINSQPHEHQ
jgi:hypothetical protein